MSVYYTDYGTIEMAEHAATHVKTGWAFSIVKGNPERMRCMECKLVIVKTSQTIKTRNSTQPSWAVEHFLVVEWP